MAGTDVLVSAVLLPDGVAREVLRRCLTGAVRSLASNALFPEIEAVLARDGELAGIQSTQHERGTLRHSILSVCD